jgi:hypothetical protein
MDRVQFIIGTGAPLSAEDNREDVTEEHIIVHFNDPKIHARLFDWLDNYPGLFGSVQAYEYNEKTGMGAIDIAVRLDDRSDRVMTIVENAIRLFCLRERIDVDLNRTHVSTEHIC